MHIYNLSFCKQIRFSIFLSKLLLLASLSIAQKQQLIEIDEVIVNGSNRNAFSIGTKVKNIDSLSLIFHQNQTLADFIQYQSPVYLKSYGAGNLSTISFRGTSSEHTNLIWNGIAVNMQSSASTDFSTIPILAFDNIAIEYGGQAIGGSVLLNSNPIWQKDTMSLLIGGSYSSMKNLNLQSTFKINKKLANDWNMASKSVLYYSNSQNEPTNTTAKDRLGNSYDYLPSYNLQKGFTQDFYFKKNNTQLDLNIWLTNNKAVQSKNLVNSKETTQTFAHRFLFSAINGNTKFYLGYTNDAIDYWKGEVNPSDIIAIDRYIAKLEYKLLSYNFLKKINTNILAGIEAAHQVAKVTEYKKNTVFENRYENYFLINQQYFNILQVSLNLRKPFSSAYVTQFTPSIVLNLKVINTSKTQLSLTANMAKNYRLPSFNERYWHKLGNPAIKPENAFNKEVGFQTKYEISKKSNINFEANIFHNLVDNWVLWNPENGYHAENLNQVLAKGVDAN